MIIPDNNKVRAQLILAKLREENLSAELYEQIAGWLLSGDSEVEKERALKQLFNEMFSSAGAPDQNAHRMYAEFMAGIQAKDGHRKAQENHPKADRNRPAPKVSLRRAVAYRVAAVLAPIALILGGVWLADRLSTPNAPEMIAVSASGGTVEEVQLPDGSTVRLKEHGTLEYAADFTKNRHVKLSGDAKFVVAHNDRLPFTVNAEGLDVKVLGTVFSMESHPNATETTVSLFSGSVEVGFGGGNTRVLRPREKFVLDKTTRTARIEQFDPAVEAKTYLKKLVLDGENLVDALLKIGRFKGVEISIAPGFNPAHTVRATLSEDDTPEQMLWMMQHLTNAFDYTINGDTITISSK